MQELEVGIISSEVMMIIITKRNGVNTGACLHVLESYAPVVISIIVCLAYICDCTHSAYAHHVHVQ